jgi:hypothetical protein
MNKMFSDMVKTHIFTGTAASQISGNNQGFIFSPSTLQNQGPSFDIAAGESVYIIPIQPAGHGPFCIYQSVLKNSNLKTYFKCPRVLILRLCNKWLTKSIKIMHNCSLDVILASSGIEHSYGTISYDEFNELMTKHKYDDDDNDDDDDEDDDDNDDKEPIKSTRSCSCSCSCPCKK